MINRADDKKADIYVVLISAPLLLTLYRYHGQASNFAVYFSSLSSSGLFGLYQHLWQFGSFFFLMLVIPALFIRYRMRRPLADFGFGLGDARYGLKLVAALIPLVVAFIYFAAKTPDVRAEYPLLKLLYQRHELIVWYEAAYVLLYYVAWEFYFRGFLLFSLKDRFGDVNAVLIQTIPSCLVHIGKPEGEILGSIIVGVLFGFFALRARSFWYVFAIHASLGVLTDVFILFG